MAQSLVDRLYQHETPELTAIWKNIPFKLFSPDIPFLHSKTLKRAIQEKDQGFFVEIIGGNFFPDKDPDEVLEGKRKAIKRGIRTLNTLCQENLDCPQHFEIQEIVYPFNPLEMATLARESWINARNGRHHDQDPQLMLQAYNFARAWGLGHLVLLIDESPEIFHSVRYYPLLNDWVWKVMQFEDPTQGPDGFTAWDTRTGVRIYGTKQEPFRYRAKVGEGDAIKYGSLLMKMFLKTREGGRRGCYPNDIYDTYGIEFLVETDEDAKGLVSFFQNRVKGPSTLERYEHVVKDEPHEFSCHKFILRVPVRVSETQTEDQERIGATLKRPLEKYIRLPIEVQIRVRRETDHALYKQQEFSRVFPLWYPRKIYEPLLPQD